MTGLRNFLDRPQSVFVRRALFQVHLWIGVFAGLYIFVVCVTGAALVFRIDMQRAMHPDLFTPARRGAAGESRRCDGDREEEYPGEALSGVDAPTTARPTYLAYAGTGDRFRTLLLDPVSAELLGELSDRRSFGPCRICTSISSPAGPVASSTVSARCSCWPWLSLAWSSGGLARANGGTRLRSTSAASGNA